MSEPPRDKESETPKWLWGWWLPIAVAVIVTPMFHYFGKPLPMFAGWAPGALTLLAQALTVAVIALVLLIRFLVLKWRG
ncbi:hypothetical protein FV232_00955 [Methylobacterium sp. WL30]|uniref:hypothetical protein n=1 Tax=unclassified Methylobacterium TaxID=2615210 RepID=UPI0011C94927|nr:MULTISPECIES: hypothetical protein [unclassified Methylobacterium]TXN38976.1 hypothetical protein FV225_11645 [Methylobacterium sp. WL93]TXN52263.1 hypothetical protein FV227_04215 [Methylobacterium sp. WL119]TXN70654.1 hypothetical protein FV232_00955 [Methylobacterium sp. WL30]